ncbi:COPII coat assembly protein sec16-like [Zea mays]|nr:COPII coat assembly protein sec16-like [Zea mays]|eukprot:XP_023155841.1 COPII coat assembly protein sec16-like [Zea mays]
MVDENTRMHPLALWQQISRAQRVCHRKEGVRPDAAPPSTTPPISRASHARSIPATSPAWSKPGDLHSLVPPPATTARSRALPLTQSRRTPSPSPIFQPPPHAAICASFIAKVSVALEDGSTPKPLAPVVPPLPPHDSRSWPTTEIAAENPLTRPFAAVLSKTRSPSSPLPSSPVPRPRFQIYARCGRVVASSAWPRASSSSPTPLEHRCHHRGSQSWWASHSSVVALNAASPSSSNHSSSPTSPAADESTISSNLMALGDSATTSSVAKLSISGADLTVLLHSCLSCNQRLKQPPLRPCFAPAHAIGRSLGLHRHRCHDDPSCPRALLVVLFPVLSHPWVHAFVSLIMFPCFLVPHMVHARRLIQCSCLSDAIGGRGGG